MPNELPSRPVPPPVSPDTDDGWVEERQPNQEGLLFTLDICRRALPLSAHPVHWDRLRYLEAMVRYWVR